MSTDTVLILSDLIVPVREIVSICEASVPEGKRLICLRDGRTYPVSDTMTQIAQAMRAALNDNP